MGRARGRLLLLALLPALAEAVLLRLAGQPSLVALAPGASAPPALDVFHDLRWVFVYHDSWAMFAGELAILLVARSAFDAALLRAAWPAGDVRPSFRRCWRRTAGYVAVLAVLQGWATTLMFAASAFPVGWIFLAGFVPAAAVAVLAGPAVVPRRRSWWPRPASMAWMGVGVVALTMAAAAVAVAPGWSQLLPVAAGAAVDALVWRGVVAGELRERRRSPVLRPAGALAAALSTAVAAAAALSAAGVGQAAIPAGVADPPPGVVPVLFVSGWRSSWHGGTSSLGPAFIEVRFSYRGLDKAGRPLPYGPADTYRSLPALARLLAAQVRAASHRYGGRRVVIVASSEGTLVTRTYLLATPDAPVREVLNYSPILQPGRVDYPGAAGRGWGTAAAAAMTGITDILDGMGYGHLSPQTPLLRSMVRLAPRLRPAMGCAAAGVPEVDFLDVTSALATLPTGLPSVPVLVVPAIHGVISTPAAIRAALRATLHRRDETAATISAPTYTLLRGAASTWQVPALPASWWSGTPASASLVSVRRSASRATPSRTTGRAGRRACS